MEAPNSTFSFDDFLIEKSFIKRKPNRDTDELKIEIKPTGIKKQNTFQLNLDITISTESQRVYCEILAVGLFRYTTDSEDGCLSDFFYLNAPAVMFPHVRAYILALTSLSGMGNERIPLMNLVYLKDELKNNTIEKPEVE